MDGANKSFISSTYWTESIGCTAAVVTLQKMSISHEPAHVARIGELIMERWRQIGRKNDPPISTSGYPSLAHFSFQHEDSNELKTLNIQLMLEKGFLAGLSNYPTLAQTEEIVDLYKNAIEEVFGEIGVALLRDQLISR